jgi:pyruvate kinase
VYPEFLKDHPEDWKPFIRDWMRSMGVSGDLVVLTEGPSKKHPDTNNRMELIDLGKDMKAAHQHVEDQS